MLPVVVAARLAPEGLEPASVGQAVLALAALPQVADAVDEAGRGSGSLQ